MNLTFKRKDDGSFEVTGIISQDEFQEIAALDKVIDDKLSQHRGLMSDWCCICQNGIKHEFKSWGGLAAASRCAAACGAPGQGFSLSKGKC